MAWSVTLDFGDTTGPRDITANVDYESFRRQRVLHNDLRAVSWTCSFDMVRTAAITTLLLGHEGSDIDVAITKDGADYFYGILTTDFAVELRTRLQAVPMKAVDNGEKLRKVIKGDGAGGDVTWTDYKVCDPGDTAESVVHQLLTLAGFTGANWTLGAGTTISSTVDFFISVTGANQTYYDLLDLVLFEHGYYFTFGADGKFTIKDAYPSDTSAVELFDSSNIVGELVISRKAERIEGVEVEYTPHRTRNKTLIFRDSHCPLDAWFSTCNIRLLPGKIYPDKSDSQACYAEYSVNDGELLFADNVTMRWRATSKDVTRTTFTDRGTRAQISFVNGGGDTEYIRKIDIYGDATYKLPSKIVESNNYANTQRLERVQAQYIDTDAKATRLAEGLEDYYRYSNLTYQWRSRAAADMGAIALVQDDILSTSNIVRITGAVDSEKAGEVKYTGEGLAAFLAGVVTINSCIGTTPVQLDTAPPHRMTVAAYTYAGPADYYCGDTDAYSTIKQAIDDIVASYGGGTIELTEGTFNVLTSIPLVSNVHLVGRGAGVTIVEKNLNDYCIKIEGIAGTHKQAVSVQGISFTRAVADTYNKAAVWVKYADNVLVKDCRFTKVFTGVGCGSLNGDCLALSVLDCYFDECLWGVSVMSANVSRNTFKNCGGNLVWGDQAVVNANTITGGFGGLAVDSDQSMVLGNSVFYLTGDVVNYGAINVWGDCDNVLVMGNQCISNCSILDRGDCESDTAPAMFGEADATRSDATFVKSTAKKHGLYAYAPSAASFLFTKTIAAGTAAKVALQDNSNTNDLHGSVVGVTHTFSAWVYIPNGGATGSEISLRLRYYDGSWTAVSQACANTYDEWQLVTVTQALASGTGFEVALIMASTAENGETFYVDDILLRPDGVGNDYDQNFYDLGTGTLTSGNTWEL